MYLQACVRRYWSCLTSGHFPAIDQLTQSLN